MVLASFSFYTSNTHFSINSTDPCVQAERPHCYEKGKTEFGPLIKKSTALGAVLG